MKDMSMNINPIKLNFVMSCVFISYDGIENFKDELWLDFMDIVKIRNAIRSIFDLYILSQKSIYRDYELLYLKLNFQLKQLYPQEYYQLIWWIKNIYYGPTYSRKHEDFWYSLTLDISSKYKILKDIQNDDLLKLKEIGELARYNAHIYTEKKRKCHPLFLTDYNKAILTINNEEEDKEEVDYEIILTDINLIISKNRLVILWDHYFHNYSYEDYIKIYHLAEDIKIRLNDTNEIVFPSIWTLRLDEHKEIWNDKAVIKDIKAIINKETNSTT